MENQSPVKFIEAWAEGFLKSIEVYFEDTSDEQILTLNHIDLINRIAENKKASPCIRPIKFLLEGENFDTLQQVATTTQHKWKEKHKTQLNFNV